MKIGVVCCAIMRREMEKAIAGLPCVTERIFIEAGKHVRPKELRQTVLEKISSIQNRVDVILLGYGECRSLKGIEDEFDIPIIHPEGEDCIAILFTPERYHQELENAPGTWFMTPGWAELGPDMILNELGLLARSKELGMHRDELIKDLFAGYKRGLYIDTGVEGSELYENMAQKSCQLFNLELETAVSDSRILELSIKKAMDTASRQSK